MWLKFLSVLTNVTSFFVRNKKHTIKRQCVGSLTNTELYLTDILIYKDLFSLYILTDVLYFKLYVLDNCPNDFTFRGSLLSA